MNSLAHSLSHRHAHQSAARSKLLEPVNTLIAALVATIAALILSGAFVYASMNNQIVELQSGQAITQQQGVQYSAFNACMGNHSSRSSVTARCQMAASTFAANDPDPAAFDRAVAYIYPR